MTNDSNNAPIATIRTGRISAAIWQQTTENGRTFFNFTLQRTYKDSDGEYQSSTSFALSDALLVAKVCDRADTKIRNLLAVSNLSDRLEADED